MSNDQESAENKIAEMEDNSDEVVYRHFINDKGFHVAELVKGQLAQWTDDPVEKEERLEKARKALYKGLEETRALLATYNH